MEWLWLLLVGGLWYGMADDLKKKGKGWFARNVIAGSGAVFAGLIVFVIYVAVFRENEIPAQQDQIPAETAITGG